eukprot:TRINITY_DN13905_c0_g1_i1.p1 TRINITY_DN13905_c0_g1~~TRINITY_DN13905_c0_g1_i1.p1  ORF type:complete len:392 (-),score=117.10 TRINITY_DN13905_c0_g1_i1:84-1259(-)
MSLPLGTVVWAKLGTYPYWPGRISQLSDTPKNVRSQLKAEDGSEVIYFFSSKNYAIVPDKTIEKWEDGYETRSKVKKGGKSFQSAIKEAEYWLKYNKSMPSEGESDEEEEQDEEEQSTPRKKSRKENGDEDSKKNGDKSKKKEGKDTPRSKSAEKEKKKEKEKRRHTEDYKKEKRRGKDSGSEDEHDRKKRSHRDGEDSPYKRSKKDPENKRDGSPEKRRRTEENSKTEDQDRKRLGAAQIQKVAGQICKHPVAKYFKYAHDDIGDGSATAKATFSTNRPDIQAEVHPSIASLHYLMDITVYLACLSQLQEMQDAQTMDWKVSILSQIAKGSEVTFKAAVTKNPNPSVLLVECEAICKGKVVARGAAVKNIINLTLPLTTEPQGAKKKEDA